MAERRIKGAKFPTVKSLGSCPTITPIPLHSLTGNLDVLCVARDKCDPAGRHRLDRLMERCIAASILKP